MSATTDLASVMAARARDMACSIDPVVEDGLLAFNWSKHDLTRSKRASSSSCDNSKRSDDMAIVDAGGGWPCKLDQFEFCFVDKTRSSHGYQTDRQLKY
jgi:hypothetical protein